MKRETFPKGFLWGASTAAHQVEGGTHNQWSEWEQQHVQQLADSFTERLGWLPNYIEVQAAGTDPANYISGTGVEHYKRYPEDFALLRQLNMNAFRFSIEWSRIEPEEGVWDEREIAHYREYISELKRLQIEPLPTLWHWTMPIWFTDKGGFEKRRNVPYFERFVQKVMETYGADLAQVITLNEPNVYTALSYISGEWPPQQKSFVKGIRVYHNLVHAHRQAYAVCKRIQPNVSVGAAMSMSGNRPRAAYDLLATIAARFSRYTWNEWFIDRIRSQQDFIGINYYMMNEFKGVRPCRDLQPKSDLGWYMEPRGIKTVIEEVWRRYKLPIIITENGLADAHDTHREWWIEQTMSAMKGAIRQGVDLRGYLHWSLLDNFEWAYGWWPKFGLVAVDRTTMRRTVRPSARAFADTVSREDA